MANKRGEAAAPGGPFPLDVLSSHPHLDSRLLSMLHHASLAIAQLREPESIGQRIVEVVEHLVLGQARAIVAVYLNEAGPRILAHSAIGHDGKLLPPGEGLRIEALLRSTTPPGVIARTLKTGDVERHGDTAEVAHFIDVYGNVRLSLCVPAITHGTVVGAINIESTAENAFGAREETAVSIVANQLAVAIENARLLAEARTEISRREEAETRLRSLNEALADQASHDDLTGLVNRREFLRRLTKSLGVSQRVDSVHALCMFDLDRFKTINDIGGHAAGDAFLSGLARSLTGVVRKRDTLARIGGDEFAVLLEHCTLDRAEWLAEHIRRHVEEFSLTHAQRRFNLTASLGIISIDSRNVSVAQVLRQADAASYTAKHSGGNRVHTADDAAATIAWRDRDNLSLAVFQRTMQSQDGLCLLAQPIVSLTDPCGPSRVEVLSRLRTHDGQLLVPKHFIGALERFKLAANLDRIVLDRVLGWLADDPNGESTPSIVNMNLSAQSIADPEMFKYAEHAIANSGVDPARLCYEITETSMIHDTPTAANFILGMKTLGCSFAIDDFGTGYASISYLRDLQADWIKFDGMFVQGMGKNSRSQTLVAMMTDVAHCFGARCVAEWVDCEDTLDALRDLGVDAAQGFYLGEPRPVSDWPPGKSTQE